MNKRQRKKHRIGEFDLVGFDLQLEMPKNCHPVANGENLLYDDFIDRWFEFIEGLGICCGGGIGSHWELFVNRMADTPITEEERLKVVEWLVGNGAEFIQTRYEFGWSCRPLTKSELRKYNLPVEQPVKVPIRIVLSAENYDKVMKTLDEPAEPNEALMEAARRYKEDIASGRITVVKAEDIK